MVYLLASMVVCIIFGVMHILEWDAQRKDDPLGAAINLFEGIALIVAALFIIAGNGDLIRLGRFGG